MQSKFTDLLLAIEVESEKAEKFFNEANKAALEIAASSAASPSQSGDRFHSQAASDMARQKHESVLALKKEIINKGKKIVFNYNGETIFIVDNPIMIKGFKFVSSNSVLGQKLLTERK